MSHVKKIEKSWKRLESWKYQISNKLFNKAQQSQETYTVYCKWLESLRYDKNYTFLRYFSIYLWDTRIDGCK